MIKSYSAIIFDLDGTLLNSIDLIVACYEATYKEFFGKIPPKEEILNQVGLPLKTSLESLDRNRASEMEDFYRKFQKENHDKYVSLYPGTIELLQSLKAKDIKVGVVTSKSRVGLDLCLHMFPRDLVQVWITADDVEHHKPHPEPLLKVAQILGVDPKKCVYIGDTSIDQSAAKAAGMDFIGVTWGAGRDLGDKVISNFYELST